MTFGEWWSENEDNLERLARSKLIKYVDVVRMAFDAGRASMAPKSRERATNDDPAK
jgi:uncharacterized protein (DUF1499 family)